MMDKIRVFGARENNLKNINIEIPKNKLVVFTGLSGSGKSTLAFDTLYAEGQRRYIESLSSYARQFLDRVGKPDVDKIEGLTPAIAIDQKTTSKNPRSTVGTITEIYDYLRLLYARVGAQHCHLCGQVISSMSASDIIGEVLKLPKEAKIMILSPIVNEKKGTFVDELERVRQKGFVRVQIDGVLARLDEEITLAKTKKHTIKLVIDRVSADEENKARIADAVEKALKESYGVVEIEITNAKELELENHHLLFSEHSACFDCKVSFEPLESLSFSFNSIKGACQHCDGLGMRHTIDMEKIIDAELSIDDGAVKVMYGFNKGYYASLLKALCDAEKIPTNKPFCELEEYQKKAILNGSGTEVAVKFKNYDVNRKWQGVVKYAYDILKDDKDFENYMTEKKCETCGGNRLRADSLAVRVAGLGIADMINMPIDKLYEVFESSDFDNPKSKFSYLSEQGQKVAYPILKEIKERLFFLYDVGLGYLSLGRNAKTISGGEAQRIRIASQIGSGLTGVMYVIDEPSIGLHERDTMKLIRTLRSLQQKGNSVIVVEHDKKTIEQADYILDIGPGAGKFGGEVVFAGTLSELLVSGTQTSQYLNGEKKIEYYHRRAQELFIEINGVNLNNIENLSVKIPLKNLVCITGVSGSGKSSLIIQTLLPVARELLNNARKVQKIAGVEIKGLERLDKVIYLDQSPIGRTPRSNPATYTGVMDDIRNIFTETKEAKIRGYGPGRFSFNVKGGRCEKCQGEGEIKIEMHFLPDIMVKCDACKGTRYNEQTLEIEFKSKNISEVLAMSVDEAIEFFKVVPRIYQKLKTLQDVGLGYITLGQNAVTLSGGEAQRIKVSKELSRKDTGKTLYILDEPTTGLHFADIDRLTGVLHRLVELENSVVVIEHNLDVIKNADYVIDMGPEGGNGGGQVVAQGSPEEVAKNGVGHTAYFLAEELGI
ncbi:MAG TPA: excinuclease ABC subunit UvrA [Campylobacterales bacterium]|nr:excinuclease ABC subunit UvrA [Campylobacterales bacterium]